jgi:hypothetical protein
MIRSLNPEDLKMKRFLLPSVLASLLITTLAQAHTHLEKAMPADGSVLNAPPSEIMLHFSAAARVTALTIQKDGGDKQKLEPLPAKAAPMVSVPVSNLSAGKYVVSYRVVSEDNHVMSGDIHFTVSPGAASSTPAPAAPASEHHH